MVMKLEKQVKICANSSRKNEICPLLYWDSKTKCKYQGEKYQQEVFKESPIGRIWGYRPTYTCKK